MFTIMASDKKPAATSWPLQWRYHQKRYRTKGERHRVWQPNFGSPVELRNSPVTDLHLPTASAVVRPNSLVQQQTTGSSPLMIWPLSATKPSLKKKNL